MRMLSDEERESKEIILTSTTRIPFLSATLITVIYNLYTDMYSFPDVNTSVYNIIHSFIIQHWLLATYYSFQPLSILPSN